MLSHSPMITTDGLVLCLDAANPRSYPGSGNSWLDLVTHSNSSLVNGASFSSVGNKGIFLDGTNDYVGFNKTLYFNLNTTFIFWLKFTGTDTNDYHLLNTNITAYRDRARISYTSIGFHNSEDVSSINFNFSEDIRNKYKQIGITIDSSYAYLIEDGNISQQTSVSFPHGSREYKTIGKQSSGSGWLYFNGIIYNFLFYNKTLSADEVRSNYLATKSRFGL